MQREWPVPVPAYSSVSAAEVPVSAATAVPAFKPLRPDVSTGGGESEAEPAVTSSGDFDAYGHAQSEELCCLSSVSDILMCYSDYAPLWDVSKSHVVNGVHSQLKPAGWRRMLSGGGQVSGDIVWDDNSHYLLDGVLHGFKIVDPMSDVGSYECKNYKSASVDAVLFINNIIEGELSSGKLSVVDRKPHCVHALGAVEKSTGGYRPITDASKPDDVSINNYMSTTFRHFKFHSMDEICAELSPGCYLAVTDISAAYRSCLIRPSDRKYQGLQWRLGDSDVYIEDNFLSFGTRASPYIFNSLTDSVTRYMRSYGFKCYNYLDDFLIIADTWESCRDAQLALHSTLRNLGFDIAYKKVQSPAQVQRYLGIDIDTVNMKLILPQDKLLKLERELAFF